MVNNASRTLCAKANRSDWSYRTDSAAAGSPTYQRVENPCHVLLDRPELNENRTAIATGMIDQRTYPRVTSGKNLDLPHGFATADLT